MILLRRDWTERGGRVIYIVYNVRKEDAITMDRNPFQLPMNLMN